MRVLSRKKLWRLVLVLVSVLVFVKVLIEIDNELYETRIESMKEKNHWVVEVKSAVAHKTLTTEHSEIHYYVSGAEHETTILFLHPAFSDHRAFDQQIDYFSNEYKVITIDLIAHGLSRAKTSEEKIDASPEHIAEILKREGVDSVHIMGVSVGALIAQYFALKYPEKVTSLTALGGYDINRESPEVAKAQRASNFGLIVRALFSMKSFGKKASKVTCSTERGQALFYETTNRFRRKAFMSMQGLAHVVKDRKVVQAPYPVLIAVGEHDVELAKNMAKEWHSKCENSRYHSFNDAGHCAQIDQPAEFNKVLEEFIQSVPLALKSH